MVTFSGPLGWQCIAMALFYDNGIIRSFNFTPLPSIVLAVMGFQWFFPMLKSSGKWCFCGMEKTEIWIHRSSALFWNSWASLSQECSKKQCKIPTSFDIILLGIQNYFSASKPRQTNNQHYSIAIDGIETNDFSNTFQRVQSKQWFSMFLPTIGPTMG